MTALHELEQPDGTDLHQGDLLAIPADTYVDRDGQPLNGRYRVAYRETRPAYTDTGWTLILHLEHVGAP
jgi:hypothetical protein